MQLTQTLRRTAQLFPRRDAETANRVARLAGGIAAMGAQPGAA
jgi:hypothetical protein